MYHLTRACTRASYQQVRLILKKGVLAPLFVEKSHFSPCKSVFSASYQQIKKAPEFFPLGGFVFVVCSGYEELIDEVEEIDVGAVCEGLLDQHSQGKRVEIVHLFFVSFLDKFPNMC